VGDQLTGGSNTTFSTYTPVRVAAAIARNRLLRAAAAEWGTAVTELTLMAGTVTGPGNRSADIGALSSKAPALFRPGSSQRRHLAHRSRALNLTS
jgi:isoquinoline 1-oxidoreductase beta subunit